MKAPIGEPPSPGPKLRKMLDELPKDSSIADVFRVISKWEKWAVREARKKEQTTKSGWLGPDPHHSSLGR